MLKFSKKTLQAHFNRSMQLLVAMLLALGPLADFHGHEEEHACAEIGHQNVHISFADEHLHNVLNLDSQLTPFDLGHNHEHPWCALCWFVSVNHFRHSHSLDKTYAETLSTPLRDSLPNYQRHSNIHQRGPPLSWITT